MNYQQVPPHGPVLFNTNVFTLLVSRDTSQVDLLANSQRCVLTNTTLHIPVTSAAKIFLLPVMSQTETHTVVWLSIWKSQLQGLVGNQESLWFLCVGSAEWQCLWIYFQFFESCGCPGWWLSTPSQGWTERSRRRRRKRRRRSYMIIIRKNVTPLWQNCGLFRSKRHIFAMAPRTKKKAACRLVSERCLNRRPPLFYTNNVNYTD